MLSKEDNELLTRTDAGTPMGDLFRRYWIPAVASNELEADGAPVRVKLLGEDLVAFRDTEGKVGLLEDRCPHRGTALYYGINDGCGLRCMYHGWKFDVDGKCVDLPSEPKDSKFIESISVKAYPTVEQGGVVWTYMGPKETMPPVPDFYWANLPEESRLVERAMQECNYAQAMENDLDFVHAAFLHKAYDTQEVASDGVLSTDLGIDPNHPLVKNPPVKQHVNETNYGRRCVAVGVGNETQNAFMEIHYIFPFYTYPPRFKGEDGMWHAFIPRDDHTSWTWDVQFKHDGPIDVEAQHARRGLELDKDLRKIKNRDVDYGIDRQLQKEGNFTGIRGIAIQDHMATEAMGPIVDRTRERLGTSDLPVIQMRRMLLRQAKAFQKGQEPFKLDNESLKNLYSEGVYDDNTKSWEEAFPLKEEFEVRDNVK